MESLRRVLKLLVLSLATSLQIGLSSSCSHAPAVDSPSPDSRFEQIVSLNFDWDDNVAFMPTELYLFDSYGRLVKTITTEEFALVREKVGKDAPWKEFQFNLDDQEGSFRNFRDDPRHNHFKEDVMKLIGRPDNRWLGPSFSDFQLALKNPRTAKWLSIITARGHSPQAMIEGLKVLQENQNLIKSLPQPTRIFAVGHPQWKSVASDTAEIKTKVMGQLLDEVNAVAFPTETMSLLDPDGSRQRPLHYWEYSDDDFGNFKRACDDLSRYVRIGRWPYVKIVLRYTGKLDPKIKPHAVVITPTGGLRPLEGQEEVERDDLILKLHSQSTAPQPLSQLPRTTHRLAS